MNEPSVVPLRTVLAQWGRIGCLAVGGPPTHIKMLRELCVERRGWITAAEFEDANAACSLLPGPASTQMSIFCAWYVRGSAGAIVGGLAFIVPGMVAILLLAALFLATAPPAWVVGAGAGAGAAVAAVAVRTGWDFLTASWARRARTWRWCAYLLAGGAAAATLGPWLVLVLLGCGLVELGFEQRVTVPALPVLAGAATGGLGGLGALCWVAFKVGALSYGGGFVIIPLMQSDAVHRYHWLTSDQFLNAVALGQVTPGPVVHTVTAVGYAAGGVGGGLLAAAIAFSPSFLFILLGARHFAALRGNQRVRAFLNGAGPAAVGAIIGTAIPLAMAISQAWQCAVLAGAAVLLLLNRSVVLTLLSAGAVGTIVALAGGPLPS